MKFIRCIYAFAFFALFAGYSDAAGPSGFSSSKPSFSSSKVAPKPASPATKSTSGFSSSKPKTAPVNKPPVVNKPAAPAKNWFSNGNKTATTAAAIDNKINSLAKPKANPVSATKSTPIQKAPLGSPTASSTVAHVPSGYTSTKDTYTSGQDGYWNALGTFVLLDTINSKAEPKVATPVLQQPQPSINSPTTASRNDYCWVVFLIVATAACFVIYIFR